MWTGKFAQATTNRLSSGNFYHLLNGVLCDMIADRGLFPRVVTQTRWASQLLVNLVPGAMQTTYANNLRKQPMEIQRVEGRSRHGILVLVGPT